MGAYHYCHGLSPLQRAVKGLTFKHCHARTRTIFRMTAAAKKADCLTGCIASGHVTAIAYLQPREQYSKVCIDVNVMGRHVFSMMNQELVQQRQRHNCF